MLNVVRVAAYFRDKVPFCKKNVAKEVGGRIFARLRYTLIICILLCDFVILYKPH